jgi:hypothetical protein
MKTSPTKTEEEQKEDQRLLGEINARAFPSGPSTQQDLIDRRRQKKDNQTEKTTSDKIPEEGHEQEEKSRKIPSKYVSPCLVLVVL